MLSKMFVFVCWTTLSNEMLFDKDIWRAGSSWPDLGQVRRRMLKYWGKFSLSAKIESEIGKTSYGVLQTRKADLNIETVNK